MVRKNFDVVWDSSSRIFDNQEYFQEKEIDRLKNLIKKASSIRNNTIVLTLPASIIMDDRLLDSFLNNVSLLARCGAKLFIVHDNKDLVEDALKSLGFDNRFDKETVEDSVGFKIKEMVISGYINKFIVSKLISLGTNCIGISGKDCGLMSAVPFPQKNAGDFGGLEKPILGNLEILNNFQNNDIVSVISPIAPDYAGRTKLVDPRTLVSTIGACLDASLVVFPCSEEESRLLSLKGKDLFALKDFLQNNKNKFISRSLLYSSILALESGVENVIFPCAGDTDSLFSSIFKE